MSIPMTRPSIVLALSLTVLLPAAGCGSRDGLPSRLPVTGRVSYNGNPLASGTIIFLPEDLDSERGAGGRIENGHFSMTTMTQGDGVIPGTYRVTIASVEDVDLSEAEVVRSVIPEHYADPVRSGLTAEVARGSTSFDFDLSD